MSRSSLVLASHRGPVSYRHIEGGFEERRGGGGLVTGLLAAIGTGDAAWIAAAITDDDRAAAAAGLAPRLISIDADVHELALDRVANEVLWFANHQLWDTSREPVFDESWPESWEAYEHLNEAFAVAVDEAAADGATVLVQDYHLCLLPRLLRDRRPDLRIGFFLHTPWAPPETLGLLPRPHAIALLEGLLAADRTSFHTARWAAAFAACCEDLLGVRPEGLGVHPLGVDARSLRAHAAEPEVLERAEMLRTRFEGQRIVLRVDRMELSKNLVRGIDAFGILLDRRPELRGHVVHLVLAVPSRGSVPAYQRYADDVRSAVAVVNARHARPGWVPVVLDESDDFARSLASLTLAEVLVVTPVRDGMNLVAKEGCLLGHEVVLVLSREAGAVEELGSDALVIDPCDISATADALAAALGMDPAERVQRLLRLQAASAAHPPAQWLADQLAALGALGSGR
jgi:trehalose 6-phosphate synthase